MSAEQVGLIIGKNANPGGTYKLQKEFDDSYPYRNIEYTFHNNVSLANCFTPVLTEVSPPMEVDFRTL